MEIEKFCIESYNSSEIKNIVRAPFTLLGVN